ncbi:MAG: AAA family ATPase [Deinococcales bacterium]
MDLLERDDAQARLGELLPRGSGHGAMAWVVGEAGVGKTALVRRFVEGLGERATVLWGECDPLDTPQPLAPVLDFGLGLGRELVERVHDLSDRDRLFGALLEHLSGGRPTVAVFEDVQWADEATVDLLHVLASQVEATSSLVVATVRDGALDALPSLHPLLREAADHSSSHRIALRPLSLDAVARLSQGSDAPPATLHRLTGGNPFHLHEALAAGERSLPASAGEGVLRRAARLEPPARTLLDTAALIGGRAEPWLLLAVLDPILGAGHAVRDATEACCAAGLLRAGVDAVTFHHELARVAVRDALPDSRRRTMHAAILNALEAAPELANLGLLAHHAEGAGDVAAVLAYAPEAGRHAERLGAFREAAAHYRRALRYGSELPSGERAMLREALRRASDASRAAPAPEAGNEPAPTEHPPKDRAREEHTRKRPGRAAKAPRPRRRASRDHPAGLTPREVEVLELLMQSLTNRALGDALHIAPSTAGKHVSSILAKLSVASRTEAVAEARRRGLAEASAAATD